MKIVPNDFGSIYSAVNVKLKTSNNKHLFDLILISPRIRLSQSENILFLDIYLTILKAVQIPPKLVINKNAKSRMTEELRIFSKSKELHTVLC